MKEEDEAQTDNSGETANEFELIQADLEKVRLEADDYLNDLKRLKAEFDNFRKRMQREQADFLKFAAQEVVVSLLPVVDNFERALAHEINSEQIDEFKNGLQIVYNHLLETLAKQGLTSLEPVGEDFDPNRHEALMQVESDDHPEGKVVQVLEKGYALNDRVIRPAKVMVAK